MATGQVTKTATLWQRTSLPSIASHYETAALPAELRRRYAGKDYIRRRLTQALYSGRTKVSPISRRAIRSGVALQRGFETLDWFAQWFETEPESLMMHRHDKLGAGGIRHFDCLLGRAMRSDPGIVGTD